MNEFEKWMKNFEIKSLAMLKMEKNFIGHNDKEYPRQPYIKIACYDLMDRLRQEVQELQEAINNQDCKSAKNECADVSNIVDFIFERLIHGRCR